MWLLLLYFNVVAGLLDNVGLTDLSLERRVQTMMDELLRLEKEVADLKQSNTALTSEVGQTVIFSGVDTNVGNAYDAVHGVFVAPISGTYHFTLVAAVVAASKHAIDLFMKKNDGSNKLYLFLDDNTQYSIQSTASSVLHLSKGERVWVEVGLTYGQNIIAGYYVSDDARNTHFSGFLIQAD